MKPRSFVGLDVHRKLVVATAMNPMGKQLRQQSFGSAPKELMKFLSRLPKPTKVVLEACSVWERYYEAAISTGAEVVLSHPRTTRMIAEASIKTDRVDSATLANLLRLDSIPQTYIQPPQIRALRKLYLDRRFYARTKTAIMQHAYARIGHHGIDYEKGVLQHKPKWIKFRRLGIPEIDLALDTLDDFGKSCKELDKRVHVAFLGSEEAQLLKSIPGIGELTAVALAGYLCPIERFPNVDKLTSYAGLCPTTHQSSDTLYHGHLKPDCSRGLRGFLIEASWKHRVHAPRGNVANCARRVSRRKGRMYGAVAGAHKLLRIVFAILKQRRRYQAHAPVRSVPEQEMRVSRPRSAADARLRRTSLESAKSATRLSHRAPASSGVRSPRRSAV
jgi:transposase